MRLPTFLFSASLAACSAIAADPAAPSAAAPAAETAPATSPLYAMTFTRLDGTTMPGTELAGKTVLFVNVASKCGYTPQYEGLQALYEAHRDKGLVVVGQPCNQFMGQEPGSSEDIASFCKMNYGVTFPLLEKADVNGKDRNALYTWLVGSEAGGDKNIKWNFEKFVVSPAGEVVARFEPKVAPQDPSLVAAITAHLPK